MKNTIISRLLIFFYFIAFTGCWIEDHSTDNVTNQLNRCWTIIDSNTGAPISTAHLQVNFFNGGSQSIIIECDNNGYGCVSLESILPISPSCIARAPDYNSKSFIGHIPGVIKLTPLGE